MSPTLNFERTTMSPRKAVINRMINHLCMKSDLAIIPAMSPTIGLNAHLLSAQAGYRRAGIHGYIWQLLDHLPAAAPDWRYRVFVGDGQPPERSALSMRRSRLRTSRPLNRIAWEQL